MRDVIVIVTVIVIVFYAQHVTVIVTVFFAQHVTVIVTAFYAQHVTVIVTETVFLACFHYVTKNRRADKLTRQQ